MFFFELPSATQLYLGLYLLTLVLHVLSMNYVLAGQTYLAIVTGLEVVRGPIRSQHAPAEKLRDWLPFALGVTITAGVAPLLFVQILYRRPFYTANLLLFHRWMAILPVLIVAFYLLYLQKIKRWSNWSARVRAAISIGIWACFAFVAWSWTENHLLSLRDQASWTAHYVSARWFFRDVEQLPRLLVWYCGAFSVLAAALGWQLRHDRLKQASEPPADEQASAARTVRTLAVCVMVMLMAGIVSAGVYHSLLPAEARVLLAAAGMPFAVLSAVGIALQTESWRRLLVQGVWSRGALIGATIGAVAAVTGGAMLRELRRLASIEPGNYAAAHAAAGKIGGLPVFVFFLLANTIAIVAVVAMVRRGLRSQP